MASTENTDPGRIRSGGDKVFGIRLTLPPQDSFSSVLGENAEMFRWYGTAQERDEALAEIRREHLFSRIGDLPTIQCEPIERERPAAPQRSAGA